jgi:hypothetical protein
MAFGQLDLLGDLAHLHPLVGRHEGVAAFAAAAEAHLTAVPTGREGMLLS